ESAGVSESPSPALPAASTLASSVVGEQLGTATPLEKQRSWTNTWSEPLTAAGESLTALLVNATKRPSALMLGWIASASAGAPPVGGSPALTLTNVVLPVTRSRTKMPHAPPGSPLSSAVGRLSKATKRPSAEIAGRPVSRKALPGAVGSSPLGQFA